jgi:hypothetical protein
MIKIRVRVSRLKINVDAKNTPKNAMIEMIIQLANVLEKNSKFRTSGNIAIITPMRTNVEDIPGIKKPNSLIIVKSKVQPIKNTVNPIAIIEEIAWNSTFSLIENHINIKHKIITFTKR